MRKRDREQSEQATLTPVNVHITRRQINRRIDRPSNRGKQGKGIARQREKERQPERRTSDKPITKQETNKRQVLTQTSPLAAAFLPCSPSPSRGKAAQSSMAEVT